MKAIGYTLARSAVALLALTFAGCASADRADETAPAPPPPPPADERPAPTIHYPHDASRTTDAALRRKLVVGLIPFMTDPGSADEGDQAATHPSWRDVAEERRWRLIAKRELLESGAFVVVERDDILEILHEVEFGESRFVNPETSPDVGEIIAVQYLLAASIGENQDPTFKESVEPLPRYDELAESLARGIRAVDRGAVRVPLEELRRLQLRAAQAYVMANAYQYSAYLNLYSVRTSEIAAEGFGIGNTPLDALHEAVDELVDRCLDIAPPPRIAYVDGDRVFIDLGADDGVAVGQRFRYTWEGPAIRNAAGQVIGHDTQEGGVLEVTRVEPLMSITRVVERVREPGVGDRVEKRE